MATKKMTLNLHEESLERLDHIISTKYKLRGTDRTKAIRWLIDDEWERIKITETVMKEITS